MEYDAVVKAFANQFLDPRDMIRREIGPHFDGYRALRGFEDQTVFGVSHALFSEGLEVGFRL